MAGTLIKSVMLKIVSNDGDTEAKLDKITAKAEDRPGCTRAGHQGQLGGGVGEARRCSARS